MSIEKTFKLIESQFVDDFRKVSESINRDFEGVISSVYVYPPEDDGLKSAFIGIDVVFLNVAGENSDSLSLHIDLQDAQDLKMNLRTSWGHPSGNVVERMFSEPVAVSDDNLKLVREKLPGMFHTLRREVRENPNGCG